MIDNAFDCVPFYRAYVEYTYVKKMQSVDEDNAEVQTWGKPLLFPNEDIDIRNEMEGLIKKIEDGGISLPSTILKEKKINLFLGYKVPVDLQSLCPEDQFKELRIRKDSF